MAKEVSFLTSFEDDISQFSSAERMTNNQRGWVIFAKTVTVGGGFAILFITFFNLYFYVYVHRKYNVPTILLFYIVAILLITCTIAYTLSCPIKDFCKYGWVFALYGESFLNLMIGVI